MRFFLDTEFIEDGKTIDLISIGIVCEDGREYYAEVADCDLSKANSWVQENVVPHLKGDGILRIRIAGDIQLFVGREKPEFWGYYADYDWVALCQLYGRMIDLPTNWPMYCRDLKQLVDERGNPPLPKNLSEHNALADARWNKRIYDLYGLNEKENGRSPAISDGMRAAIWEETKQVLEGKWPKK